jgi:hypothetical protein
MLINIGFKEAELQETFQCFIFHDVDLIPEDDAQKTVGLARFFFSIDYWDNYSCGSIHFHSARLQQAANNNLVASIYPIINNIDLLLAC